MKRRSFLKSGSVMSLPIVLGGSKVGVLTNSLFSKIINADDDRVFVLIQQNGGNDGLATIIPIDQYSNLTNARSDIIIPESQVLKLTDETGLHPSMPGLKTLFDEGVVTVIQNVGYANQNRSHFRSSDIWNTGSTAEEVLSTGWVGRYLDDEHFGYPDNYPNEDNPHPIAITLGPSVSETCQGLAANFSLAISDLSALGMIPGTDGGELPDLPYGDELNFVRQVYDQTNKYSAILTDAAEKGTNESTMYPEGRNNRLADQLKVVAQLISGGLQTKVYIVNINGFDTHADQVDGADPLAGNHSTLLSYLSTAIQAFMDDLRIQGLDERVVGATRSEFGRQIKSNGSLGTDHGEAAPLIVFGSCVNGGIIGDNPVIPSSVPNQMGVPTQLDFKNVFGSILVDWFGAPESLIGSIFSTEFEHIPIVTPCDATTATDDPIEIKNPYQIKTFPNPFFERLTVTFKTPGGHARISLFNESGQEVHVFTNQKYSAGEYTLEYNVPELPPGHYYSRFLNGGFEQTKSLLHF